MCFSLFSSTLFYTTITFAKTHSTHSTHVSLEHFHVTVLPLHRLISCIHHLSEDMENQGRTPAGTSDIHPQSSTDDIAPRNICTVTAALISPDVRSP